ncbi:hypothetical protein ACJ73_03423 [Blastomyces percursus]|uniref:AP-3 complex subunit delta n=1 Tax=Blastomyces percursus TaxID=1658174 RepID=A0A1J9R9L0_9EURO|nr:hypothetical protein ACJ73_03423 [Blastomyces percursus]
MFGYDMSWAAFHVLEVMSSAKYPQKRVGYLGAVQSFRPDTEVLMLATNLLKKDIVSPLVPTMSLPLLTLPHIISPSLALSLLTDVLPRLSHSHPAVRKKAVVNLYRLSLVYPEAFRIAWPKIKERLMDEQEDSSVTAAVINVVCELGWRRPQDFLPLAPRLFDLLVDGGNNWMAIKIIKLVGITGSRFRTMDTAANSSLQFATLTPLEPRLVRKLLRPLTNIIQTTTAMSLLYECINGVIQGGILDGAEGVREGEEIANLCVEKLRGMIVMEGDPNLKYVALLAFNRIVTSHPTLVAMQQDVIMDCLDDNDISIRLQALELVSGMVSSDSLHAVVSRLITQLQTSPAPTDDAQVISTMPVVLTPSADIDGDDPEEQLQSTNKRNESVLALPNHYRNEVLQRILDICSRDTYASIVDFEWYIDILVQLVRLVPPTGAGLSELHSQKGGVAGRIGYELRNVAVRVKSVRPEATRAAELLILIDNRGTLFPVPSAACTNILEYVAWIVGEYAEYLEVPDRTLTSLLHPANLYLPGTVLSSYLQAIPKLFISLTLKSYGWDSQRQTEVLLVLARITDFLEKLSSHPDLDVQERAIEFLELLRLTAEAISSQDTDSSDAPLLLSSAIPSLFTGVELNPVAVGAQKKVPQPENLDLDKALNDRVHYILTESENGWLGISDQDDFRDFYYVPDLVSTKQQSYNKESATPNTTQTSYQNMTDDFAESAEAKARRRAERRDRNKDDPFYIGHDEGSSGTSTPFHQVLLTSNGEELDIDSIPIIDLAIESSKTTPPSAIWRGERQPKKAHSKPKKVEILGDETITVSDERATSTGGLTLTTAMAEKPKIKRSLLEVDSSGLSNLSLDEASGPGGSGPTAPGLSIHDIERREAEEAEMAKAMLKIERLRLEMQRAADRVEAHGVPPEGTLVKRKKKTKKMDQADARVKAKTKKKEDNGGEKPLTPNSMAAGVASAVSAGEPVVPGGEVGDGEVEVKRKKKRETTSSSKKKKDDAAASSGAGVNAPEAQPS